MEKTKYPPLPQCDALHPVRVRYASFDGLRDEVITDSSKLFALSLIYGDFLHIVMTGNN